MIVEYSRPLVSMMVVSGPLDYPSSQPLDRRNGSDLDGAPFFEQDVLGHFRTRLFVCLGFSLRTFLSIMADEVQRKIPVKNNIDWVADDPRTTPKVRIPEARQRICSTFKNGGFPMYQIAFEHMGLRLPFTDLERSRPRGNMTDKCGWVSLKQHKKFFEIFEESLRGFKDKWKVVLGPDGKPIEVDSERFPFCWSTKHYAREAKSFTFKKGALSKEELADLKALEDFVEDFPPSLWEDREGNPICDEDGYQLSSKKYINIKALLKCATRTEAKDVLRDMKNTQLTLRKLQADKKRREAGGTSSSTVNTSAQSSPSKSIDLTGEKRIPEGMPVDKRPPKSVRTEAGGGSMVGGHKLVPGRPAAEFVIPPAMGHECLVVGKTSMKISDADQSILASMGPESIRNVVAESSVAVFKLLEVATFLNGRECKYLQERDEARAHAKDFGERLSVLENDLSSETKALKESQAKVAQLEEDLKSARKDEETLNGKVVDLEEKLASMMLTPIDEEKNRLDPTGTYAKFSRADLIARIYQIGDLQLEVASSSFKNAVAQLQILNPDVQLVTEGMDEMKEVRDGQIATPPLEEEE
ncbi:hypothetical protein TSUD_21580 [Trifolium subterraneum]|uniref:Uncharacterized protein n=1 Tax=Trifolium subterraneum TaxID=3900 RepID=A0A2Z6MAG2_TRISU|nr:hypothetical protein TSUD_21580 [Trifolium subterraneum]